VRLVALVMAAVALAVGLAHRRPPRLRLRVPPPAYRLVPVNDCPAAFLQALRQHPHWTIRIDAMEDRGCGLSPQHRFATITVNAGGARWQRDERDRYDWEPAWHAAPWPSATDLLPEERAQLLAALARSCEPQSDVKPWSLTGARAHLEIALDPRADPVIDLERTPMSLAVAAVFDEVEQRYVAERAAAARTLSVKVKNLTVRDRHIRVRGIDRRWDNGDELDDATLVFLADCLRSPPAVDGKIACFHAL
jgi:hypothetical protein